MKKYHFFWKGELSNWALSLFTLDDVKYANVEQYMMHQKALLMKDFESADNMLRTSSPRLVKSMGRQVKNFDSVLWDQKKYEIVKKGISAKFKQNPHLKNLLLAIKCEEFVEASPFDPIWGIGFTAEDALKVSEDSWGENLLGKIITEVRNELKNYKEEHFLTEKLKSRPKLKGSPFVKKR